MDDYDGRWDDRSCSEQNEYACERVVDGCPDDDAKGAPGVCGCGVPDDDTDGDGTLDCLDECAADPARIEPGQCGCLGHASLKLAGAPCSDGLCSANDECDGAGSCGSPQECAPSANRTVRAHDGHAYSFCPTDSTWQSARTACQSVAGTDLVHVGDSAEDAFVWQNISAPAWIGATDAAVEGKWSWADDGVQFWSGKWYGSATAGAHANWHLFQPDDLLFSQDCAIHKKHTNGWLDESCGSRFDFVCEVKDFCPDDPTKLAPGTCGCGLPEIDTDSDGVFDCEDGCPWDPNETLDTEPCTPPPCAGELADLAPRFECVLTRPGGERLAVFGVHNYSSCFVDVPLGPDNEFEDGPAFRGQPTRFQPGFSRALVTPIESSLTWRLGERSAVATANGPACDGIIEHLDTPVILEAGLDHGAGTHDDDAAQLAQPIEFEIPERLRVTLGNAGNGQARFTYRDTAGALVTCNYRGGSSMASPRRDLDRARGRFYHFESCSNGKVGGELVLGTDWGATVLSGDPDLLRTEIEVHVGPGCSGFLEPAIMPDESIELRQSFDWATTAALPALDSEGLPALRYALIYIESKHQIASLRRMRIHFQEKPIFASELERYIGKCGKWDNTGDLWGTFVYALVPAQVYNFWREYTLDVFQQGHGAIPFRAVILPEIPDEDAANPDGTVSWRALQEANFRYFDDTAVQQPGWLDDAFEIVEGFVIGGPIGATAVLVEQGAEQVLNTEINVVPIPSLDDFEEWTANAAEDVVDTVESIIGDLDQFFSGTVNVRLDLSVRNRDPVFGVNDVMRRGWGAGFGEEIAPEGIEAEILSWVALGLPGRHSGTLNRRGEVRIPVARNVNLRGSGLCFYLENDAAVISSGITKNQLCDFNSDTFDIRAQDFSHDVPAQGFLEVPVNDADFNYLTQMTDGYDYMDFVVGYPSIKQAQVTVGPVALMIGWRNGGRAFTPCFDYPPMQPRMLPVLAALTTASSVPVPIPLPGLPITPFGHVSVANAAQDIMLMGRNTRASRGIATHEYGHFVMCDAFHREGALAELYATRLTELETENETDDGTTISMEAFADFFASQVVGGVNYFPLSDALGPRAGMSYCTGPNCLERNYRASGEFPTPLGADGNYSPFLDHIRRLVSVGHDAFDHAGHWRGTASPTNADPWTLVPGLDLLTSSSAYQMDHDPSISGSGFPTDRVSLPGTAIETWLRSSAGGQLLPEELQQALAFTMRSNGRSWCDICPLFVLHDAGINIATASTQEIWERCMGPGLAEIVGAPPQADLRMSDPGCATCGEREFSDASGVCQLCGDHEVLDGNACRDCGFGFVRVGDVCVECEPSEINLGNVCSRCAYGTNASRTTNLCEACPINATVDIRIQTDPNCAVVNTADVHVGDNFCPFILDVQGVSALAASGPTPGFVEVAGYSTRVVPGTTDCQSQSVTLHTQTTEFTGVGTFVRPRDTTRAGEHLSPTLCSFSPNVIAHYDGAYIDSIDIDRLQVWVDAGRLPDTPTTLRVLTLGGCGVD